ncbi:MAG: ABC transporter substrate-binding protein [Dehalococcoidia bacterium]|nr:ABC transporter substrate-binding protein [Dehalococcoidia bacterium]
MESIRYRMSGVSRRRFLGASAATGAGLAGAALMGCSSGSGKPSTSAPAAAGAAKGPTAASILGNAWGMKEAAGAVPKYGGVLNDAAGSTALPSLDPFQSTAAFAHRNASMVYSHLLHNSHPANDRNELIFYPDIATSWEINDAAKWVFKIRNDVKWQNVAPLNGRPMTVEDVKYAIDRAATDKQSPYKGTLSAIKSIDTPDATTLILNLKTFDAGLFPALADRFAWIMPKELIEAGEHKRRMVGTGPFIFQKWEEDVRINYKRNPDYYIKGTPFIDEVNQLQTREAQTRLASLRSGAAQMAGVEREDLPSLVGDKQYVTENYISVGTSSLMMNYKDQRYKDIRVRRAISLIGNPDEVLKIQGELNGGLWRGVLSAQNKGWVLSQEELKSKRYYLRQDLQEAKQLMTAAGFPDGLTTKYLYRTGSRPEEELPQYIAATAKKAGVANLTLVPQDSATMRKNQDEQNYDSLCSGIDGEPLPEAFLLDYRTGGPKNGMGLSDPALDAKIDKATSIPDTNARREVVLNLAREILENVMWKRNFTDNKTTSIWRTDVKNYFGPVPQQYNDNGFAFLWIDKG